MIPLLFCTTNKLFYSKFSLKQKKMVMISLKKDEISTIENTEHRTYLTELIDQTEVYIEECQKIVPTFKMYSFGCEFENIRYSVLL